MPEFSPFPGVRYARKGALDTVCAPPYDVVDPDERAALLARDPHNAVRLILPDRYDDAAADLRAWSGDGTLVRDAEPSFTVYRMTFRGDGGELRHTTGVIGAVALDGLGTAILPHERTLPKAKSDRLELLRATRANLDPIWGLSLTPGLSALFDDPDGPVATAHDDGVVHEAFRLDDPRLVAAVAQSVARSPLVLADGHHRYETAVTYSSERTAAGLDDPGSRQVMAFVVELAPEQLVVQPIHRLLGGLGPQGLRAALGDAFTVHPIPGDASSGVAELEAAMHDAGGLGLVDADGLAVLVPGPALEARMADGPAVLRDVDSARFDAGVVPALGDASVTFRHDAATVATHVAKGVADAAILLRAVTVEQIGAAAHAGVRMPEKTTFFAPKPRTGMVFRRLDE